MINAGDRLGPYEIRGRLGAGGMGEVYLARDVRLEREVALKVLPPHMTRDPEEMARFRREALTLASLNHPNIATIHGLEEMPGGPLVLVLERVEGISLGDRLKRGEMPVEEALHVCAVIALALEVAHERGIVHRDLKPANVMIGARGLVKVLDFGLARRAGGLLGLRGGGAPAPAAVPPAPHAEAPPAAPPPFGAPAHPGSPRLSMPPSFSRPPSGDSPPVAPDDATIAPPRPRGGPVSDEGDTIIVDDRSGAGSAASATPISEFGAVSGTPGYMSPEQVVAGAQDERTDVFALGCVLYECLSGRRAFPAADAYAAMASVLTDTPDFAQLPERTPARVRELLVRCLEKEVEQRLPDMRSARLQLEEALGIRRASALREGEQLHTPNNLPADPTPFLGREATLAECAKLVEGARLVTLLGMGGSGKTRLAVELARQRLASHPDGVWFVDLAPLADAARVADVLVDTIGAAEEQGRSPLATVTAHLGAHQPLLVIDNCEDVLAGVAPLVTEILRACPGVRIVATSREPLAVAGETLFPVPTLGLPSKRELRDPQAIMRSEAVQLFVARARAAHPAFDPGPESASVLADICARLDGIPLAIELAAARVRMLALDQIRARLDDRFRLLTGGKGAVTRHQTLLATLQWSWDHLAEPEQELMRRLAVFVGSWSLERATAVATDHGDDFEVLDLLTRLVERSLVVVNHGRDGGTRYRFLETVWRFSRDRLEQSADLPDVRARHVALYVDLSARGEVGLTGPEQGTWSEDLHAEENNLLAAFEACAVLPDGAETGLRLATASQRLWTVRGNYETGRRVLLEAIRRDTTAARTALRATALVRAAGLMLIQGNYAKGRELLDEALTIYRELGDRKGIARALAGKGVVAMYLGDFAEAWNTSAESREIYRELGEKRGVAMAIHNLATAGLELGRIEEARSLFEESIAALRDSGDETTLALSLGALSQAQLRLGEPDRAAAHLRECFEIVRRRELPREGIFGAESCAELALAEGHPTQAARLLGAAAALRTALGVAVMPHEQRELDSLLERLRAVLGADSAAAERARGGELGFEDMVREVEAELNAAHA